ncbi:hypothetical protein P280DRAFT_71981 [Massarina eburnea CBS 473.64]|uniref:Zn(2)-C6 fungal-type domain-containing protein n=1 Tax=Massarina eburnea CBS 473.64 TaxID=1395130 RepID=A0A6A6RWB4_9PLEO|nr:hypothetical protein P280DRAFT_71981 [Massarina eburnea CBS 473.64]
MPKRSPGCFECRQRKVRCDETKPECTTCLRRGTKCPGYRPTQTFVLHKFGNRAVKPLIIKEDDNRYRYANQPALEASKSSSSSSQETPGVVGHLQPYNARLLHEHIPRRVSPMAVERVQYMGTFLSLYLPKVEGQTLPPPSALILSLPSIPVTSQTLLAAVDALSAAQLAVSNRNYPLINRSRSLYGTALSQMLKAIQDPARALEDETLLATYLLTLYEVFVGLTNGHGFFYHVQGLLHLLKQRGPNSFQSRFSLMIYHAIRYNSLSIGYHVRKASMLDSPDWMALTERPAKKDPYVALVDICIGIPRLLERTDKLIADDKFPDALEKLLDDSLQLAGCATEWFVNFEKDGPRYSRIPINEVDGFLDTYNDRTFDPVFFFHTFGAGICYMIYSMSMLILQSNTFRLLRQYRQLEAKDMYIWDQKLGGYADMICRSVPYNCRPIAGYTAKFGALTPLVVARKYFEAKKAEEKLRWCERVYQGTRVPGLYSTPIPMEPLKSVQNLVQKSGRYL